MAGKFRVNDKHRRMAAEIAAGEDQYKAWLKHFGAKGTTKRTAATKSTLLCNQPPMKALIASAIEARNREIEKANVANLPAEFKGLTLTIEQLDMLHYSIILGRVQVEDVIAVHTYEEILDDRGRVVKRLKKPSFMKVKREPNIRERQISIDAIYKRFGSYAPAKLLGAFGKVNDEGELDNIERFALLSTGEKIPL